MTDDAVESILKIHKKYRSQNNICGYAFLRAFPDGKVNGKKFDVDEKIGSYIDVRVNGDDTGADKPQTHPRIILGAVCGLCEQLLC